MSLNEPSLAYGQQSISSTYPSDDLYPYEPTTSDNNDPTEVGPDVPFSLVQRSPPLLMGDGKGSPDGPGNPQRRQQQQQQQQQLSSSIRKVVEDRLPSSSEVVEVLHTLLPPITLQDARGRVWKQYCATPVSNRSDVYQLQDTLDAELIERQARPYGICPVRELLYSQSFDELLRQVALESPERGLMLLRVRDQLRMSIACYQTLFHNSTNFGTKRAVMGEKTLLPYQNTVQKLTEKKLNLQAQVYDLKDKLKVVEEHETETSDTQRKQFDVERNFLEQQIIQLRSFLRTTGALEEEGE